ncbi:MAG: hydrogenase maturation protease [Cyanobacteria bacterium SBLK]|nr:hydrogenase maturation protease [Cyanobacteria bacterium SBLK]
MTYLAIGYGNPLRSDDGAGQKVAELVANWHRKDVRSLPLHQLTPELADEISRADIAIFIDATPVTSATPARVQVQLLEPLAIASSLGHNSTPQYLLSLAKELYHAAPKAYWILIPAVNFEFGEKFSPITEQGIKIALKKIEEIIGNEQPITNNQQPTTKNQ